MENGILTVTQTAKYLQVCDKTVRRMIAKKELAASKVGNSWRIKLDDIELYLELNKTCRMNGELE